MTRWLVQFGYDGGPYAGWARQPGRRTVEAEILEGLVRCGIAPSPAEARPVVASRTDRGVSARANALGLTSRMDGPALLRALNGISPAIVFHRARPVAEDFRVRAPRAREYRYFLPANFEGTARWNAWMPSFVRDPIDARSFARGLPGATPCWRRIDEMEVAADDRSGAYLRVRAGGFLWGMVRKIVGALGAVEDGRVSLTELTEALRGHRRLTVPLASPEPLVLWEVDFGTDWPFRSVRAGRSQRTYFARERARADTRARTLACLGPADAPGETV